MLPVRMPFRIAGLDSKFNKKRDRPVTFCKCQILASGIRETPAESRLEGGMKNGVPFISKANI